MTLEANFMTLGTKKISVSIRYKYIICIDRGYIKVINLDSNSYSTSVGFCICMMFVSSTMKEEVITKPAKPKPGKTQSIV